MRDSFIKLRAGCLLVVSVAHPREGGHGGDDDGDVREDGEREDGVVFASVVAERVDHLVRQPDDTRDGASCVNTAKVLQDGCAAQAPPERCPLQTGISNRSHPTIVRNTLAKSVLTKRYKRRPKISLRIRIEKLKFPTAKAPANLVAYGQWPETANPNIIMLMLNAIVNSLL